MIAGPFEQLMLCTMTSPDAEFEDRVVAAAAAGYGGIGLRPRHRNRAFEQGLTDADMAKILSDNGVTLTELEVLSGWGSDEATIAKARAHEDEIYAIAEALGGRHVTVTGVGLAGPLDRTAELFAGLCDRAAEHGLRMALEFLPWTEVPDADHAREIVQAAGRPNGGVQVDTWHHFRGAASDDQLRALPPELVVSLQFDDGLLTGEGTLFEQTFERLVPGEGEFQLAHFLQVLAANGVTAPLGVEVISKRMTQLPVADAARITADATNAILRDAFEIPRVIT
jgi:sugar phosphate isomerase/epimerase